MLLSSVATVAVFVRLELSSTYMALRRGLGSLAIGMSTSTPPPEAAVSRSLDAEAV
jgi:hypothetical protein